MWIQSPLLLLLLVASSCSQQRSQSPPPAEPTAAAALDAGTPRLELSVRERLADGGIRLIELQQNERTPIEPTRQLELSTNAALRNYRIRMLDETDRALISDDVAETADHRLDYQISFHEPLKPGHRYTLVLDAQSGSSFSDADGNAQPERRLEFQITGEREKAPPSKRAAKKRRR